MKDIVRKGGVTTFVCLVAEEDDDTYRAGYPSAVTALLQAVRLSSSTSCVSFLVSRL